VNIKGECVRAQGEGISSQSGRVRNNYFVYLIKEK
jgi:hypothetical protein